MSKREMDHDAAVHFIIHNPVVVSFSIGVLQSAQWKMAGKAGMERWQFPVNQVASGDITLMSCFLELSSPSKAMLGICEATALFAIS